MTYIYIILLVLLLSLIGAGQYLHIRHYGNRYHPTYQWFRKLIK